MDTSGERSAPSRRDVDLRLQELRDWELDFDQRLRRIVELAVEWLGARYGALGVIGEDGSLSDFIQVGMDDAQVAAIGRWPQGQGVLGELIRNPDAVRLAEVAEHPAFGGFPEHHPVMHSFLGMPVYAGGEVWGSFYLADKHGGGPFSGEDESLLWTLAVAAGSVIDGQRWHLYHLKREHQSDAVAKLTRALLAGEAPNEAMGMVLKEAKELMDADLAMVAVPTEDPAQMSLPAVEGMTADRLLGQVVPVEGTLIGEAMRGSTVVFAADVRIDPRTRNSPARRMPFGPTMTIQIRAARPGATRGVLQVFRLAGRPSFSETDLGILSALAGQAELAFELAERREQAEEVRLMKDRDRIARDLHDLAIQRMIGAGMSLQSVLRLIQDPTARQRVAEAVAALDDTSKIIRSTIFELEGQHLGVSAQGLRARLAAVVENAVKPLGFPPALRMEGLLDTTVPPKLQDHLQAVLIEGLSNIARHAHARHVDIEVAASEDEVVVTVDDDGVGMPEALARRSGLNNLAERARDCGGQFGTENRETGGTRLRWSAPLHQRATT